MARQFRTFSRLLLFSITVSQCSYVSKLVSGTLEQNSHKVMITITTGATFVAFQTKHTNLHRAQ